MRVDLAFSPRALACEAAAGRTALVIDVLCAGDYCSPNGLLV